MLTVDGREVVSVCFLVGVSPYNAGEGAGFRPEFAHRLVALGAAEYVDPKDGPKRLASPEFRPADDREQRMLAEIVLIQQRRTLNAEEEAIVAVTSGDARYVKSTGELKRRLF